MFKDLALIELVYNDVPLSLVPRGVVEPLSLCFSIVAVRGVGIGEDAVRIGGGMRLLLGGRPGAVFVVIVKMHVFNVLVVVVLGVNLAEGTGDVAVLMINNPNCR